MLWLDLRPNEKESVQRVMEKLQDANPQDAESALAGLAQGDQGPIQRFLLGSYNHPLTWWMGLFQLQMQYGMWGAHWKGIANARASILWQVTAPLRNEAAAAARDDGELPILSAVVRYNLKYRKADISGRVAGGIFTNYASTAGRFGNRRLSSRVKLARGFTNLGIASYGAAVKAIATGHRKLEEVIQAVVTGNPGGLPLEFTHNLGVPTPEEAEVVATVEQALGEMMSLSQLGAGPGPIKEFCSRPENVRLEGVCR